MARLGDTRVQRWLDSRTFQHSAYPAERLAVERDATVSVCGPAAPDALRALVEAGVIDEIVSAGAAPTGDVIAFLPPGAGAEAVCGIVGPIVCEPGVAFCSGFSGADGAWGFERTHPELGAVREPVAMALRRDLLDRLAPSEPGIELLLAAHAAVGLRGTAQTDIGAG